MSNDDLLEAILSSDIDKIHQGLQGRGPNSMIEECPILHWVISTGNSDVAMSLLDLGADPNSRALSGETALISAAYMGGAPLVSLLIKAGADITASDNDGQNALMAAAKGGHFDVVRQLVEAGVDVSSVDSRGRSVLHWALTEGDNKDVVQFLLKEGAPQNLTSTDGLSPRDYAIMLKRPQCAAVLGGAA